jgi:hypothetical protein
MPSKGIIIVSILDSRFTEKLPDSPSFWVYKVKDKQGDAHSESLLSIIITPIREPRNHGINE